MTLANLLGNYKGSFAGQADGSSIAAGKIGERLSVIANANFGSATATGSGTAMSSLAGNTHYILQSASTVPIKLTLTPGVWDVYMSNTVSQASKVSQGTGVTLVQNGLSTNPTAAGPSDFERCARRDLVGDSGAGLETHFYAKSFQNISSNTDLYSVFFFQGSPTGVSVEIRIQAIRIA
jgi:hypothetical protein